MYHTLVLTLGHSAASTSSIFSRRVGGAGRKGAQLAEVEVVKSKGNWKGVRWAVDVV